MALATKVSHESLDQIMHHVQDDKDIVASLMTTIVCSVSCVVCVVYCVWRGVYCVCRVSYEDDDEPHVFVLRMMRM